MKYIEELTSGDIFTHNDKYFILTSDFKSNGKRLSYCINDGFASWFNGDDMVEMNNIYTMDDQNNILPIKTYKSETHANNN